MLNQETGMATVQVPLCRRQVSAELNGDFSLPDYQPEIRRLLRINAAVRPPARYAGSGSVDLGGTVDYFVLYAGSDGGLYCAPLSAEYRMTVPFDGQGELSDPPVVLCDPAAETVSGRVTAPRRLNIRCRVGADVTVMGEVPLGGADDAGFVPGTIEKLTGGAEVGRVFRTAGEALELQDDVIVAPDENLRVVCAEGQVMVTEASSGTDTVSCRGEVTLKLTVVPMEAVMAPDEQPDAGREPARPRTILRKLPFSQTVELPGVTPACRACAHGVCDRLSVSAEDDRLHTNLDVVLEVLAQRNEPVTYVRDSYSTASESSCTYETHTPSRAVDCLNGNFSLNESVPLSEAGIDPGVTVVDVTASARADSLTVDRDRCLLAGTCSARLLYEKGGEYGTAEVTVPFRYEADAPGLREAASRGGTEPLLFNAVVDVITCRTRMDGERIGLDAEIAVALRTAVPAPLTVQSGMTLGPDVKHTRGEYVICFPAPSDTLWSVAKRYHAPLTALSAANELTAGEAPDSRASLEGIKYLIV
ncbi:MAG: DUF3794 domain-containing protein [Clostridia bacterium]|nr:DUF3794 domain-containing protein [Clostridia bacterium]